MNTILLYYLLLSSPTLFVAISGKYIDGPEGLAPLAADQQASPQDYNGPWGEGVKCPYQNPPAPNDTNVFKGSVPPAMTTDAVTYLNDANFKMFQVSEIRTYPNLTNLYFVMRKEFHTWHYSNGKVLTGCWKGVTVYQYINQP